MAVLPSTRIPEGSSIIVATMNPDTPMAISKTGASIVVNGVANVLERDILANNGIVHFVDRAILVAETWQPTASPTQFPTTETKSPTEPGATTDPPTTAPVATVALPTTVPSALATMPSKTMVPTDPTAPTSLPTVVSSVGSFCFVIAYVLVVFVCSMLL